MCRIANSRDAEEENQILNLCVWPLDSLAFGPSPVLASGLWPSSCSGLWPGLTRILLRAAGACPSACGLFAGHAWKNKHNHRSDDDEDVDDDEDEDDNDDDAHDRTRAYAHNKSC